MLLQIFYLPIVRIARTINNDVIPVLSKKVIDRLCYRFKFIVKAFSAIKKNSGKKIINFEFLTVCARACTTYYMYYNITSYSRYTHAHTEAAFADG